MGLCAFEWVTMKDCGRGSNNGIMLAMSDSKYTHPLKIMYFYSRVVSKISTFDLL